MSDWKVISKEQDVLTDLALTVASFGIYAALGEKTYIYVVKNEETGDTKRVRASDSYALYDRISEGDFIEE